MTQKKCCASGSSSSMAWMHQQRNSNNPQPQHTNNTQTRHQRQQQRGSGPSPKCSSAAVRQHQQSEWDTTFGSSYNNSTMVRPQHALLQLFADCCPGCAGQAITVQAIKQVVSAQVHVLHCHLKAPSAHGMESAAQAAPLVPPAASPALPRLATGGTWMAQTMTPWCKHSMSRRQSGRRR